MNQEQHIAFILQDDNQQTHTCGDADKSSQDTIAGVHDLKAAAAPVAEEQGSHTTGTSGQGGGHSTAGNNRNVCCGGHSQL